MKNNTLKLIVGCFIILNIQTSYGQQNTKNSAQVDILTSKLKQMEKQLNTVDDSSEREQMKKEYIILKDKFSLLVNGKLTDVEEQMLMNEYLSSEQYDAWKVQKVISK